MTSTVADVAYWVVMPAAGSGSRMGSAIPKQYLTLLGRTVLEWAVLPFVDDPRCKGIVVVVAANDTRWPALSLSTLSKVMTATGGHERADSVLAGLALLAQQRVTADDWVLVHDAARPCLRDEDIESLLQATEEEGVGALLALPVADTLKRAAADGRVMQTVPRDALWRAQTPQMFRFSLLRGALQDALGKGVPITDESAAVEALGLMPRLLQGHPDNVKVTLPEDLPLAEQILLSRKPSS